MPFYFTELYQLQVLCILGENDKFCVTTVEVIEVARV